MKRRKPIDPQGHVEGAGRVPVEVECRLCYETRLKGEPWRRPCTKAARAVKPPEYMSEGQ